MNEYPTDIGRPGGRRIGQSGVAHSCYFRTSTIAPDRKALLQITERCNLHCAHCFVSSTREGSDIPLDRVRETVLPQLREARVRRLTLTGGEPFAHPEILDIVGAARKVGMSVTICTNATLLGAEAMDELARLGGVRCNVSLDGFASESHGRFRGVPESFAVTKRTISELGRRGLLKGLLATPNSLAQAREYGELCAFARASGAEYVLLNPLASMGRGVRSTRRLAASGASLAEVRAHTAAHAGAGLDVVHVRFPNDAAPLAGCEAGTIVYVFATGDVTVCPYLVFAARTPQSQHSDVDFIVGNIFEHADIAQRLDAYRLHDRAKSSGDPACDGCALSSACGRGCPAAVVAAGGVLGDRDRELCPFPDAAVAG